MIGKQKATGSGKTSATAPLTNDEYLTKLIQELTPPVGAEVSTTVQALLKELAARTGCDRCRVLRFAQTDHSLCAACGLCSDTSSDVPDSHCLPAEGSFRWLGEKMTHSEVVSILQLDDFPAAAGVERRYYERAGYASCVFVPLHSDHFGVAAIALESKRGIEHWSDELAQLSQLAGRALVGGLRCLEHRRCVFQRLDLERIVAEIGADVANSPDDELIERLRKGLEAVGKFARADGCVLIPLSNNVKNGIEELWWTTPQQGFRHPVFPDSERSHILGQMRAGRHLRFRDVKDLAPDWQYDRQALVEAGITSGLVVPVSVEGECFGAIGLWSFSTDRAWPENWVPRLGLIGQIFANGLMRGRKNYELEKLKQQLQDENAYLRKEIRVTHRHDRIVGESTALRRVLDRVEAAAPTLSTILVLGETGTGKELIADAIHELSARKSRAMITVNCAAIPASLAESELFGHSAGAYTGADTSERGRFEMADGSTIFLDEIGELPMGVQAKLLRVLQDGEFRPVGCPDTRHVDVRVIAATNRELEKEVRRGRFRADLYHRLNVIPISVPPLRDRTEDIPQLVWAFVDELGRKMGRSIRKIPKSVIRSLQRYSWPGNIRELRHVVERAMVLEEGDVLHIELPRGESPLVGSDLTLKQVEQKHIQQVLERTNWRVEGKDGAAEILGLKPSTLRSRLAKLGVRRKRRMNEKT